MFETPKTALMIRTSTSSQLTSTALLDLFSLKKPNAVHFTKKTNQVHPFDEEGKTSVEFWSRKNDASLFVVAANSKKRPHTLTFGRIFDYQLLDMLELHLRRLLPMEYFETEKAAIGSQPAILFHGELFTQHPKYIMLRQLLLDLFRVDATNQAQQVALTALQHVVSVTAPPIPKGQESGIVYVRVYRIVLKKSGTKTPRVELEEMGPFIDFSFGRIQEADDHRMRQALKLPRELRMSQKKKENKNVEMDDLGDEYGRVHMEKQDLSKLQTRKMKGLKDTPMDSDEEMLNADEEGEDVESGERKKRKRT